MSKRKGGPGYAPGWCIILYASLHPGLTFNLTAIGCGLAGYKPEQIAPMFADAPENCVLPEEFKVVLKGRKSK